MTDLPLDRRQVLVREAARLFHHKGYDRTTVRDLADAVGILSGSLFHHFRSKEDILQAVMLEASRINTEKIRAAAEAAVPTRERLFRLIRAELEALHGETRDAMSVLFFQWRALSEDKQQPVLRLRADYESCWLKVLAAAHAEGLTALDAELQRRLLTGSIGWTIYWYQPDGRLGLDDLADGILRSIVRE